MRILELGTGLLPAYTGKILADQGNLVTKVFQVDNEPLCHDGVLWNYLNSGKKVLEQPIYKLDPMRVADVVFDNVPEEQFKLLRIDPERLADQWQCTWVSWHPSSDQRLVGGHTFCSLYLAFQIVAAAVEKRAQHVVVEQQKAFEVYNPRLGDLLAAQLDADWRVIAGI